MAIKILYSNLEINNEANYQEVKSLMAKDSSWGTFIDNLTAAESTVGNNARERWRRLEPKIANLDTKKVSDTNFALVFNNECFNFAAESIDHFVSTIAGDIITNKKITNIEVKDFEFTEEENYSSFPGPNIGIEGIYNGFISTIKEERPVLAFSIKPRSAMTIEDLCKLYIAASKGGVDIVEEDERLVDPIYCPFKDRIDAISKIQNDYPTLYSANITGDSCSAIDKLKYCYEKGIRIVKLDVLVCGFETLRKVSLYIKNKLESNIAVTVYPDVYDAYRKLGRDFILNLARLCGADIIYAGSPNWARFSSESGNFKEAIEPVYQRHLMLSKKINLAPNIKSTLASITNDQHPCRAEIITTFLKKHNKHSRFSFFVGGGISAFPANIEIASSTWMNCLRHASKYDLDKYVQYDFKAYEKKLDEIGWKSLIVKDVLYG